MPESAREYCDLVMKGGVTSGIVYPNAALALSERFTFKNIGGTSAGAIAAAATAAAALGKRRLDLENVAKTDAAARMGFAGLQIVADQLRKRGFIFSLFQPARGGGAAFAFTVRAARRAGLAGKILPGLWAALRMAPVTFAIILAILLGLSWLIGGRTGLFAALLPALLCALAAAAIAAAFGLGRVLRRNQFGLCPGLARRKFKRRWFRKLPAPPALSDWLHEVLQGLAGQPEGRPLLFDDLWGAPRYEDEPATERSISLEMITTDVSHREPRSLPISASTFWFRKAEFERLFPAELVAWMIAQDQDPIEAEGETYYRLPRGGQMPVLVATRMSLSFPLLLSAVPLHEPDFARSAAFEDELAAPAEEDPRRQDALDATEALTAGGGRNAELPRFFRPCWFSDGGISSNFPIHLFDAPLPRWPTFAINLLYPQPGAGPTEDVFLPANNNSGWQRRYEPIAGATGLAQVSVFLFAIVGTMQNWRDLLQARAPGHRDRIVHVALSSDEGGMNLNMPQTVLDRIAGKGAAAGQKLVESFDFNNHYWVRWRNVAGALERFLAGFAKGAGNPISQSYAAAHASAATGTPKPPSYPFTQGQQEIAEKRFAELRDEGELWADTDPDLSQGAPRPSPELRVTPTF